jgi:hypothetical protein
MHVVVSGGSLLELALIKLRLHLDDSIDVYIGAAGSRIGFHKLANWNRPVSESSIDFSLIKSGQTWNESPIGVVQFWELLAKYLANQSCWMLLS